MSNSERYESDSMGTVAIPASAYWGAQTQRAVANFGVSELRIPEAMIRALAYIKKNAAKTNAEFGLIESRLTDAITRAGDEVAAGRHDEQFPIDVFQTGSGTSWNMNINEVLANRANEMLGEPLGTRSPVHPNDHVNRGQSSNDVIPTAIQIANRLEAARLLDAVETLRAALGAKSEEFADVVKLGRTHLQDAVPMTLGQEFGAFAEQTAKSAARLSATFPRLEELPLGGTAVGTGINCAPEFAPRTIAAIAEETGVPFRQAENLFEGIAARDAQVELMGVLNTYATSLMKIANDLRLLASGPRGALGEITLPSLQPGSSIMPGKVNPVIPEMIIQVAAHVSGKTVSVTIGGQNGPLELNIMQPLLAYETLSALRLLSESSTAFAERCIAGISAEPQRCEYWVEWSLALVTPLALEIGYDRASQLAYRAFREQRTIREVALEEAVLPPERLNELLDPRTML